MGLCWGYHSCRGLRHVRLEREEIVKIILCIVVLLTGCTASINRIGPDSFVATATYGESGGIYEANEFCAKHNLAALITEITPSTERAYSNVYFKCLNPNSAEYRNSRGRPVRTPTPNVIIQDNRQR